MLAVGLLLRVALGGVLASPQGVAEQLAATASKTLRVVAIDVQGQVAVRRTRILAAARQEDLVEGGTLLWPRDPRIARVEQRLRQTGFFRSVRVQLRPRREAGAVDLVIVVQERPTWRVDSVYVGNSRMTPLRAGLSMTEHNFLGRDVRLSGAFLWTSRTTLSDASRQQSVRLGAEIPPLGPLPVGFAVATWFLAANEPHRATLLQDDDNPARTRAINYTRLGGQLGVVWPLPRGLSVRLDYVFERVHAPEPQVTQGVGARPVNLVDGMHRHTSLRAGFDVGQAHELGGALLSFNVEASSPGLGSAYEYLKVVGGGAYRFRLPWKHFLTPKVTAGQIAGRSPRFAQFYAGDLSDWVPGRELGIMVSTRSGVDVFGTQLEARTLGVMFVRGDLEYSVVLMRRLHTRFVYGADFMVSAGVFSFGETATIRRFRRAHGQAGVAVGLNADLGVRLDTAIGTMALTVGNALRRTPL